MRTIPQELQARLESGATSLCWCWRVTRDDGAELGFTDHDQDLFVDGSMFQASSADPAGALEASFGFEADTSALAGLLSSEAISEADVLNGLFDGAKVEILRVDWTKPELFFRAGAGHVGEIKRGTLGFEAELKAPAARLSRTIGQVVQRRCNARLGDARCGVDLADPGFATSGGVAAVLDERSFVSANLGGFVDGWFDRGRLTWKSGENAGGVFEVDVSRLVASGRLIELSVAPARAMSAGDTFDIETGCDKRWSTCVEKFSNFENFRGFPMLPGNDWIQSGPRDGELHDGRSLWDRRRD